MGDGTAQESVDFPAQAQATRPKRRWYRFSLRTLIYFVLLSGSVMLLWHNSASWVLKCTFHDATGTSFSADSKLLAVAGGNLRLFDTATGRLIKTLDVPLDPGSEYFFPVFSADGKWLAACDAVDNRRHRCAFFWRTSDWSLVHTIRGWEYDDRADRFKMVGLMRMENEGPVFEVQEALPDELKGDWLGKGTVDHPYIKFHVDWDDNRDSYYSIRDIRSGAIARLPGEYYGDWALSWDGMSLVTYNRGTHLVHCRRPIPWWGVAWLWEFWLTVALAVAFILSVFRKDGGRTRKTLLKNA